MAELVILLGNGDGGELGGRYELLLIIFEQDVPNLRGAAFVEELCRGVDLTVAHALDVVCRHFYTADAKMFRVQEDETGRAAYALSQCEHRAAV